MGRHSTYTQKLADEICERLSKGEPLAQICRDAHMPAVRTVYDWRDEHESFAAGFARARDEGFDVIALDSLSIIDTPPERYMTEMGERIDPASVAWAKSRAEQRLKLLAKWDPRRYGDKIEQTVQGPGGGPVETKATLDVSGLTDEQLKALASIKVGS